MYMYIYVEQRPCTVRSTSSLDREALGGKGRAERISNERIAYALLDEGRRSGRSESV